MSCEYYSLEHLPDFTMAKYSTQEGGSVEDILKQHQSFYRQLNRRGQMFKESYTLLYWYDSTRPAGKKIKMMFCINGNKKIPMIDKFIASTALAASFALKKDTPKSLEQVRFPHRALLIKKAGEIIPSSLINNNRYYVVDEWKSSETGRLMGLFRLMKAIDQPCVYSVRIWPVEKSESYRSILQTQIKWMKSEKTQGLGLSLERDENAEKCIKLYNDTIDRLRSTPHFMCEIGAYANDSSVAKLLVDAAAAEAVEEGNYYICSQSENNGYTPLIPAQWSMPVDSRAPKGLEWWPNLFFLKEIVPLATFPTLYQGEFIEIPKETAPNYEKKGLNIGKDNQGYDVYVPLDRLPKHALIAGVPGSGKTFTMLHIASQLSSEADKIPILVLEPAKQEYRALARNPKVWDLTVFAPGGSGAFPLRINPFEFPRGMKLAEHIVNLRQVFIGAFDLEPPMPFLLDQGIENVYRSQGWYPFDYNEFDENGKNIKSYPNMQMLFDEVEKLLNASDYAEEIRNNLKTVLQVRIGSLTRRETGNVFNVPYSTFKPEEWMEHSCVIELESLGKDAANFLTLLLSTIIREFIKQNPKSAVSPRHVVFFEEAHNLIGPHTEANQSGGNAKTASTKFIVDMLAEVRALKEGIIIADQLPTSLASQVTKNTSLKIGLRITAQDDREMLASTMSADGVQLEQMALFNPGHALCLYEGVQKPFEVQITPYSGNADPPDNEMLYQLLCGKSTYQKCMERDYGIMFSRFNNQCEIYMEEWINIEKTIKSVDDLRQRTNRLPDSEEKKKIIDDMYQKRIKTMLDKVKLSKKHAELIMSFGEYVCVNRYMREVGRNQYIQEWETFVETVDASKESEENKKFFKGNFAFLSDEFERNAVCLIDEMRKMYNRIVSQKA
jgi:DNA helicase HerA-like ATPase